MFFFYFDKVYFKYTMSVYLFIKTKYALSNL